jgi:alpha-L-rhamnosidase
MTTWQARFIAPDEALGAAPLLRRTFDLDQDPGQVAAADLVLSALGVVEASLEGVPVSPDVLTPGWSSYEWRLRYARHDVTALLTRRRLTLGLALGDGWWRGRLGWGDGAPPYGDEVAGLAELRITYRDGAEQVIATDRTWSARAGAVTANSLYDGQEVDARRLEPAWATTGADDAGWVGVREVEYPLEQLEPYLGPPVRRVGERAPERVWTSPGGRVLVDFGQNLVGWVRVRVRGDAGAVVTLRHAEVLEHGELGTRPLRAARATDRYTLSGDEDLFEPTFTFHGFRYVEVDGWPGGAEAITGDALTAVVVSSDLTRTGWFETSDPLVNRLHENVVWGMRGNFLDLPTDCPQRDERLGWTGDIAAFAPTACFLADASGFLSDWLRDLALEQRELGYVPYVVPDVLRRLGSPPEFEPADATAVWADAAVWVPWALWEAYGDREVLARQYDSILDHVRHVRDLLSPSGLWDAGFQFGDWLDPDAPPDRPDAAKADKGVVATACAYRSADLARRVAQILGHADDAAELRDHAAQLRRAFREAYVTDGRIASDATTVYALAIVFGLLDEDELGWAGGRLSELVAGSGYRIATGFAGTPFVTDALTATGHADTAYRLLLQREVPSWLYPVTMGATTVWERWDSMLPDGSINPGEMTSFNHYALGAVADWLHRVVGGLAPLEPGYGRVLVAPVPGGGLAWARTTLDTRNGRVAVAWEHVDGVLTVDVAVPVGVEAVVRLPDGTEQVVGGGSHRLRVGLPGPAEVVTV